MREVALMTFFEGRAFLMQDRRNIPGTKVAWGFFGGGIEKGETPEEAVVREIEEELTFQVEDFTKIGEFCDKTRGLKAHMYILPLGDKMDKFDQKEGQGMRLVTIQEAMDICMSAFDKMLFQAIDEFLISVSM